MDNQIKLISKIFGSELILKVILGFTSIIIARYLEKDNYANLFFFFIITNLCVSITSNFFNKLFFSEENKSTLKLIHKSNIRLLLIFISLLILLVTSIISPFDNILLMYLAITIVVIRVLYLFEQTQYQSVLNFKKLYFKDLVRVLLYCFPVLLYLYISSNYLIETIIIIQFISFFVVEILFSDIINFKFNKAEILTTFKLFTLKNNKHLFLYTIIFLGLTSIDSLMLKTLSDNNQLANYGAAFTLYTFIMLGLSSVHKFLLPKVSSSKISEFNNIIAPLKKARIFIILIFLLGLFVSEHFFNLVYGQNKFSDGYIIFNILSLSAILSFEFSPYSNLLVKTGSFKFQLKVFCVGFITLIILNYTLIPSYGAIGVALNNLLVYFCVNFSIFLKAKKIIKDDSQQTTTKN